MKKLILLLLLLSVAAFVFADVIIGTGTSTQYTPMSTYWNYYRTAAIYTAAEINASGTITDLQWYCGTANTGTGIPTKIYMKYTPATTLAADTWVNLNTETTEVFNATIIANATGWFNFDITDFAYDTSLGNLMVLIETGSTPFVSPYVGWRYTSTSPTYMFVTANADGTIPTNLSTSYNRPNIKFVGITQEVAPGIASLVYPTPSGVTGVSAVPTLQWAAGSGTPTQYDIYFGETLPAEGSPNVADYALTSWSPGVLDWNTTYSWKIVPENAYGSPLYADCPTWTFTTMEDPTVTPNYMVDFETWPVQDWTQLNYLWGGTPTAGTSWYQDDWLNVTAPVNKAAKINIYYTHNAWLVSPPVAVPAGTYEVKFDLAFMAWNSLSTPVTPGNQADDRLLLVMADNPQMNSNPVILREWNNTGSAHVLDNIAATGETHIVPLTGVTGTKYFAFYAESILDDPGDNDLMVDNFWVRETPTSAIFSLNPDVTDWDFGMVPTNNPAYKTFTVSNTGVAQLTFGSVNVTGTYYSPDPAFDTTPLPAGQSRNFTVKYLPTVEGGPYAGALNFNFTRETRSVALSGSAYAPATLPFAEGWESGAGNWTFVNGAQTNAWYIGTVDPYEGSYSAYVSNDAGVTNAYNNATTSVVHIYQDFAFDADCLEFPLNFKWKCQGESSYYDYLQVFVVDTNVTPVAGTRLSTTYQVGTNYNLQADWQDATITLPGTLSGTTKRVVFSWWNDFSGGANPPINFDNVSLTAVPEPTGPILPPHLVYPTDGAPGMPFAGFPFQFAWNNGGSVPDVYNMYIAAMADLPETFTTDDFFAVASTYENVASPFTPAFTYVHGAHYVWTVGAYSATYPDEVFTWPPYEFVIENEAVPGALVLSGTVVGGLDASLSWMNWNGPTSAPGWIYWGSGSHNDAIGTGGAAEFSVAQKIPTGILGLYNGDLLTKVNFYPYVAGATYNIRLWTGTDGDLAPVTQVYEQPVPIYTADAWNEVLLTTPYPINNANALYIGYYVNTTTGYPAGCDAGPQVPGLGNLIQWSGTWSELTTLNAALTYNWCIQGYVSDVVRNGNVGTPQISIPVQNKPLDLSTLRNNRFTTASGTTATPDRALQGYNLYRDGSLVNTAGYITGATYYDVGPGLGTHNYQVEAVYVTATVWSNVVSLFMSPIAPYALPFEEAWDSSSYATQNWATSAPNWLIDGSNGERTPFATFSWSPQITNYETYLTGHPLVGAGHSNIWLSFEMALNNYSISAENWFAAEVWNGTTWNTLQTWSSFENAGAGWGWTYYAFDITPYAAGHDFQIRFKTTGVDSYGINYWYLDNINVYEMPATLAAPVANTSWTGTYVLVGWTEVPGSTWYGLYGASDPYGTYSFLGIVPSTFTGVYFTPAQMQFYQVTAGAGALPGVPVRGQRINPSPIESIINK